MTIPAFLLWANKVTEALLLVVGERDAQLARQLFRAMEGMERNAAASRAAEREKP